MTRKQRIIQWLNVFLLVINISAFVTFLLMNMKGDEKHDSRFSNDEFLKTELGLSDDQYKKISVQNNNVFRSYQLLLDKKCELNFELIDRLALDTPSQEITDSLIMRIGKLESSLKNQTVRHFSNIKSICNKDQKVLLEKLVRDMLEAGSQCKYCNKINCERRDQLKKSK